MPAVPLRDPASAVQADPRVPEHDRFCGRCGKPVGRGRDGAPGLVEGFCPHDGTRYSFRPRLSAGDIVDRRYEILGALAHGGLGWIYLARDRNISEAGSERWVVLKGLINTGDPDAMAAAVAERRFLVGVDHPNIVKIYDFAQHPDPVSGELVGYIVMEYVGGRSLRDLALDRRQADGRRVPLPLPEVLAYGLEVLPALGYLHDRGLLFCDMKPDNLIHAEEQLKLIDLGGVRRIDDDESALYGTPGYQAPEVPTRGASVASDLYTVGRTLAVLSFDFTGFTTRYAGSLPPATDVPLLAAQESYHRFLKRATDPSPGKRFGSAAEMAEQLLGVLREVLSAEDGLPRPAVSNRFTGERRPFGTRLAPSARGPLAEHPATAAPAGPRTPDRHRATPTAPTGTRTPDGHRATPTATPGRPAVAAAWDPAAPAGPADLYGASLATALPLPLVDPTDPGTAFLATLGNSDPTATITALRHAPVSSPEVIMQLVRSHLDAGDAAAAQTELDRLPADDDWRRGWYAGLVALAANRTGAARASFAAVRDALPGEPAVQLALAAVLELDGDPAAATRRYARVWAVDRGYVSAAFGLARMARQAGDRAEAVRILDEVPESSSRYVAAQVAAVRTRLDSRAGMPTRTDLVDASARIQRLELDAREQASLAVEMFHTALALLGVPTDVAARATRQRGGAGRGQPVTPVDHLLGQPLTEREIRLGLERAYRSLAALEHDRPARYALVDLANSVRPWTVR